MTSLPQVFLIFLKLGCISFGGPTAHLGYFHSEFVQKRKWLSETDFADLIALCQFLPGPASSQVGLSIGLLKRGKLGALAAWAGFTLPSTVLLIGFAYGLTRWATTVPDGFLRGLMIVAAAVVIKALWIMGRKLCPDMPRLLIALLAAGIVLGLRGIVPALWVQLGLILMAALIGVAVFKTNRTSSASNFSRSGRGGFYLGAFAALLIGLPIIAFIAPNLWIELADVFYRTGAMVFGGGHVVLPVLEAQTVPNEWVSENTFLAGYGATQAVPGPLFTFAAFLGTATAGWVGGILALLAIYIPSFLLIFGVMPYWDRIRQIPKLRAALMAVNAAVVGLLLAALWDPVLTGAVLGWFDAGLVAVAVLALTLGRVPPWALVIGAGALGWFWL